MSIQRVHSIDMSVPQNSYLIIYFRYQFRMLPTISLVSFRQRVNYPTIFVTLNLLTRVFCVELAETLHGLSNRIFWINFPIHQAPLLFHQRSLYASQRIRSSMSAHTSICEYKILVQFHFSSYSCSTTTKKENDNWSSGGRRWKSGKIVDLVLLTSFCIHSTNSHIRHWLSQHPRHLMLNDAVCLHRNCFSLWTIETKQNNVDWLIHVSQLMVFNLISQFSNQ